MAAALVRWQKMSLLLFCVIGKLFANNEWNSYMPTYCVDPAVHKIFGSRIESCLGGNSALEELQFLKEHSMTEYQRAHELVAYYQFVISENPSKRDCSKADFEYVPLLVLPWKVGFPTLTGCTAFGRCRPRTSLTDPSCDIKVLVQNIMEYSRYVKEVRGLDMSKGKPRFVVTSAYNIKSILGMGLPDQVRKGEIHSTVSTFIENTFLGHYERIAQCADLFRKLWKRVIEIPYIPYHYHVDHSLVVAKSSSPTFLFSGRLRLWGSERVCSVRVAVAQYLRQRTDTTIIEITETETNGPPLQNPVLNEAWHKSTFCLIAKSDSYSTSAFYNAIQHQCIPIVISDWFVFSFWWIVPYSDFVIRISEIDFLRNPNFVLDEISKSVSDDRLRLMRASMKKWASFLQFSIPEGGVVPSGNGMTPLPMPFQAMLVEIHQALLEISDPNPIKTSYYTGKSDKAPTDISAKAYRQHIQSLLPNPDDVIAQRSVFCRDPVICSPGVFPMRLTKSPPDMRPYLCQHSPRLIGYYKIVFFMQCVRILWPLTPGKLLANDLKPSGLSEQEKTFITIFHNSSLYDSWDVFPYPAAS